MMSGEGRLLTFKAEEANITVSMQAVGSAPAVSLEYNKNDAGWLPFVVGTTTVTLENIGDYVKFRGTNTAFASSTDDYNNFVITGQISASGDLTSILNEVGGDVVLQENAFIAMFRGCTSLVQAPELPSTTLANYCYNAMYYGCTSLVQVPELPATSMANSCYSSMFRGCTSLVQAPALPATSLANSCYNAMFRGCTSLVQVPELPAITLAGNCYNSMFYGCTSLVQAPALPATSLANSCYNAMFRGCTSITSHDVATLNNSADMFYNNTACASFTVHASTPPTIGSDTITGLKADCAIYVPAASVDDYKTAQYWSDRTSYIQAIP